MYHYGRKYKDRFIFIVMIQWYLYFRTGYYLESCRQVVCAYYMIVNKQVNGSYCRRKCRVSTPLRLIQPTTVLRANLLPAHMHAQKHDCYIPDI